MTEQEEAPPHCAFSPHCTKPKKKRRAGEPLGRVGPWDLNTVETSHFHSAAMKASMTAAEVDEASRGGARKRHDDIEYDEEGACVPEVHCTPTAEMANQARPHHL